MFINILLLILGMALLVKGADWFVNGSSAIAKALRIPPLVVGLTLVSMGTSAPEASVSIHSALNGMSDMSIGNVVGSNIFNTLLILGVSSIIVPLSVSKEMKKYDVPVMIVIYAVLILFSFVITPFRLDIYEAVTMLVIFIGYTVFLILRTNRENQRKKKSGQISGEQRAESNAKPLWLSLLFAAVGLAGIIFGGNIVVDNAAAVAKALGMSETLVGLTIVAVGTSLPELVTSIGTINRKSNVLAVRWEIWLRRCWA